MVNLKAHTNTPIGEESALELALESADYSSLADSYGESADCGPVLNMFNI